MTDQPQAPEPDDRPNAEDQAGDDGGAALEESARSIQEAKDAGASVAAHEDITTLDDERAGTTGEDPDGAGGRP